MPQYLYQLAYTPESLAAQIKNPQDRLELVGKQLPATPGSGTHSWTGSSRNTV